MKTVLIADDIPTNLELVRITLEHSGYQIYEAKDGIEVLEIAREKIPDLIILDLHMPLLDGFGAIRKIRQDNLLASIPVMALTASAMAGDRERAIAEGFNSYLAKPIRLSKLREEVKRLLG